MEKGKKKNYVTRTNLITRLNLEASSEIKMKKSKIINLTYIGHNWKYTITYIYLLLLWFGILDQTWAKKMEELECIGPKFSMKKPTSRGNFVFEHKRKREKALAAWRRLL